MLEVGPDNVEVLAIKRAEGGGSTVIRIQERSGVETAAPPERLAGSRPERGASPLGNKNNRETRTWRESRIARSLLTET